MCSDISLYFDTKQIGSTRPLLMVINMNSIPKGILLSVFSFSLDFRSLLSLHNSILNLKLVCKRFNKLLKSRRALLFWEQIYETLGWKRKFKTVKAASKSLDPRYLFQIDVTDHDEDDICFCGDQLIMRNEDYAILYISDNRTEVINAESLYSVYDKYLLIKGSSSNEIIVYEQTSMGYISVFKFIPPEYCRYIRLIDYNGPGIVISYGINHNKVIFSNGDTLVIDSEWCEPMLKGIFFYSHNNSEFYDFNTKIRRAVVTVKGYVRSVHKNAGIVIFTGNKNTCGADIIHDKIIWTIDKTLSDTECHQGGLFSVISNQRIYFRDIFTGKCIYISLILKV